MCLLHLQLNWQIIAKHYEISFAVDQITCWKDWDGQFWLGSFLKISTNDAAGFYPQLQKLCNCATSFTNRFCYVMWEKDVSLPAWNLLTTALKDLVCVESDQSF